MKSLDELLALFKGELSYTEIMGMPKKRLYELRDVRYKRLVDELKSQEKQYKDMERDNIRKEILSP